MIDRLRPIALAITTHIRGNRMEACIGERIDLVTPRIRAFRKAVAQQSRRTLALLDYIQVDAVGVDGSPGWFAHDKSRCTDVQHYDIDAFTKL